jgi:hypothetical protein
LPAADKVSTLIGIPYLKIGYPERTSGIECGIPAAGDQLISRLEAAPTEGLSNGTWTFQISR